MSDIKEFTCSGCKLSTWSMYDLHNKPHIDCQQGSGHWVAAQQLLAPDSPYVCLHCGAHISSDHLPWCKSLPQSKGVYCRNCEDLIEYSEMKPHRKDDDSVEMLCPDCGATLVEGE